jgi:hypothetical protein
MLSQLSGTAADLLAALPMQLPNPDPEAPEGLEELGSNLISWLKWITTIAGFGGLLWCGIMMAIGRRNRSAMAADGATGIPWVVAGLSTVAFGFGVVTMVVGL